MLVLCCIGGVVAFLVAKQAISQSLTIDPVQAAKIGHEIVDYTLPPGYREKSAMNTSSIKNVTIGPLSPSPDVMILVLAQFSPVPGLSQEENEQRMRKLSAQSQRDNTSAQIVGTQQVTIRGQSVTLTVTEGKGIGGRTFRYVTGIFPGNGGTVMLTATGDKDSWNQTILDNFLASIK